MGEKKDEGKMEQKEKLSIGILYLGLHNQLIKKFGANTEITRKEMFAKIGRHYILPNDLKPWLLKEMENAKLIERINRDMIKILPSDIDIEKEHQKLYNLMESYFGKNSC